MNHLFGRHIFSIQIKHVFPEQQMNPSASNVLHIIASSVCFLLLFCASCTPGIAALDCTTDEECVEEFGEDYQTCGNSETEGTVCCQAGTEKCPCLEDNTCLYDLVCYEQDLGDTYPQGRYCNYAFVEAIPGLERVE
jgi:hypothetical protein